MSNLNEFLTFDSESAYDFAYDFQMSKNYSVPKIYTAKGDLTQRWYVYFSYRNPKTGKLQRMKNVYGKVNNYKTKEVYFLIKNIAKTLNTEWFKL